ncbi:MAG: extra-cytoplasmic solute receptor [Betaproteobacteria bacterium]|nr:extra-cytoplasmic solute receptor [Betaproteobacteria bacterium]
MTHKKRLSDLSVRYGVFASAIALAAALGGTATAAPKSFAEANSGARGYPSRPVRLIVPFAPGGSDVPARMLAQKLSEKLGVPFVVDNRPGASGVLGAELTAKAAPDGYTLLFATASHAVTAVYYEKLPFDPIKDFTPISAVGSVPFSLSTHPSLGVASVKEFVALAKTKPGQLNYSSPGTGSIGHLANVLLAKQTGIQVTHVAYKGTGPAVTALLTGEVQFSMPNLIGVLPHLKSGKIRVLGVASAKRVPSAPEIPTFAESGVRGAESGTWYGVLAPRGASQSVVELLNREIVTSLETQALREQLATVGVVPEPSTPQQFASFIRAEIEKWGSVMKYAGMKKESY